MKIEIVPHWSKSMSGAAVMINARSETAASTPAFRDALKFRRCLIPADGFYEWQRTATGKQPFCFEVNGGELFAFAGLWDHWKDPSGHWVKSCSILTTTANAVTALASGQQAQDSLRSRFAKSRPLMQIATSSPPMNAGMSNTVPREY